MIKQRTKQWSDVSDQATEDQKFHINLHKGQLGLKMKQLKLDVQALKHELKVQTDMVRRRRKEVTVTRTQASAKSEPCGNNKKEMAKLTMSKEDRNTCNYFGVLWSLKNIEKGNKTINLVVNQYVNKQLRRREKIKQMMEECLNKEKMLTKQKEIDNKLTKVCDHLAVKISRTKTKYYTAQRINRWYKLVIDQLKTQIRELPSMIEKTEQELKVYAKSIKTSLKEQKKIMERCNLSVEEKQRFSLSSQQDREERWSEIEQLQQIVYEIKHCDRVFISDKIRKKLNANASAVFNTFANNIVKRAHEKAVQRAMNQRMVYNELYKKPKDERKSEIVRIWQVMDQITKVTSELKKCKIDVFEPTQIKGQVLRFLKRHEEMYSKHKVIQNHLHKVQEKMVIINHKRDCKIFENKLRVNNLICRLKSEIEKTLQSNKDKKNKLTQFNKFKAHVQIFSHWKLTKLEQMFKIENTKIKTNSNFNPANLTNTFASQYIQELSTFLHCMHLIKKLNRNLLKKCRDGAILPSDWTTKHKRTNQKLVKISRKLNIDPLMMMQLKVQQYNFEQAGLRPGRKNHRVSFSIRNINANATEDEFVDPQNRKVLLTFMKPLNQEQLSRQYQKHFSKLL